MDNRFLKAVIILIAMALAYSVLSSPGNRIDVDVPQLKTLLLYVMLGSGAYALWVTCRPRRPPPGL